MTKLIDGYTLMHEHVKIDLSRIKKDDDTVLDLFDETVTEFKKLYDYGVRNVVDVTNIGMGRDIEYMDRVREETGINILYSTGFYKDPFFPDIVEEKSIDELANISIKELTEGICQTDKKASIIAEIGTSKDMATENEKKVFKAMAKARRETETVISTHTSLGTLGLEQAKFLIGEGINPEKIIIGHIDLSQNIDLIFNVLDTGVNIAFDTVGKNSYAPDSFRLEALKRIKSERLLDRVVLSLDITRKSHLKVNGGIGYCYMFTNFIPYLKNNGFEDEDIDILLRYNPKRILG